MKRSRENDQLPKAKRSHYEKNVSNEYLEKAAAFWQEFDTVQEKLSGKLAPIGNPKELEVLRRARIELNYFGAMPCEIQIKIIQQLFQKTINPRNLVHALIRLQKTSKSLYALAKNNHNLYQSIKNYTLIYPIKAQNRQQNITNIKLLIFTTLLQSINYATQEEQVVEMIYNIKKAAYSKETAPNLSSYLLKNCINFNDLNNNQKLFRYLIRKFDPKSISNYLFTEIKNYNNRQSSRSSLNLDTLIILFINLGIKVNKYDNDGKTILIYAAQNFTLIDPMLIEKLLELQAAPNLQDSRGYTALMYNIESFNEIERSSLIRNMLLTAGADPNIINRQGETALDLAVSPRIIILPINHQHDIDQETYKEQQIAKVQNILNSNRVIYNVAKYALKRTKDSQIRKMLTEYINQLK